MIGEDMIGIGRDDEDDRTDEGTSSADPASAREIVFDINMIIVVFVKNTIWKIYISRWIVEARLEDIFTKA